MTKILAEIVSKDQEMISNELAAILSAIDPAEVIGGGTTRGELIGLCCALKHILETKPSPKIVEIGSWRGRSTACIAQTIKNHQRGEVSFHAVDVDFDADYDGNIAKFGLAPFIKKTSSSSRDALKMFDQGIDLLFIDGDHSYETVSWELKNYADLITENGIIIGHDYWIEGVKKTIDEWTNTDPRFEEVLRFGGVCANGLYVDHMWGTIRI